MSTVHCGDMHVIATELVILKPCLFNAIMSSLRPHSSRDTSSGQWSLSVLKSPPPGQDGGAAEALLHWMWVLTTVIPQADTWTAGGAKGEQAGTTAGETRGAGLTRLGAAALTARPLTK